MSRAFHWYQIWGGSMHTDTNFCLQTKFFLKFENSIKAEGDIQKWPRKYWSTQLFSWEQPESVRIHHNTSKKSYEVISRGGCTVTLLSPRTTPIRGLGMQMDLERVRDAEKCWEARYLGAWRLFRWGFSHRKRLFFFLRNY